MALKLQTGSRVVSGETDRLEINDVITVIQRHRLRWYGRILRKNENEWMKKSTDFEVKGVRPTGRPTKT